MTHKAHCKVLACFVWHGIAILSFGWINRWTSILTTRVKTMTIFLAGAWWVNSKSRDLNLGQREVLYRNGSHIIRPFVIFQEGSVILTTKVVARVAVGWQNPPLTISISITMRLQLSYCNYHKPLLINLTWSTQYDLPAIFDLINHVNNMKFSQIYWKSKKIPNLRKTSYCLK